MYNAASAAEALAFQFQRCFCRKSISFPFPKLPLRQGSEKRHRKNELFYVFRLSHTIKKSLKSNFFEKVVFFDASKRSKRLKGEKSFQLGSAWRLAAPAALLIFEKGL